MLPFLGSSRRVRTMVIEVKTVRVSAEMEDTRQSAEVLEMFYMLTWVGVLYVCQCEIQQAIQLVPGHVILCKSYFS